MIKAVVFDLDGMTYLTDELFSSRFSREFNISHDKVMDFFKNYFEDCQKGKIDTKEAIEKYLPKWGWTKGVDKLFEYWFENGKLNEKMIRLIEKLKQKGIICILCTNNEKYRIQYLKEKFKINKIFDHIVASCDIGARKPNKKIFEKITEITELSPSEIVFFDNKKECVGEAIKFGFKAHLYINIENFIRELDKLDVNI